MVMTGVEAMIESLASPASNRRLLVIRSAF
jgi:hypothetical protein